MGIPPVMSLDHYTNSNDLINSAQNHFQKLKLLTNGDVTGWMDIIRTCRQPQVLWKTDYIVPKPELEEINNIIRESEILLFGDYNTLELNPAYTADIQQLVAFNTIRAHIRAEENQIDTSVKMFEGLLKNYYDKLPVIRQSNLLMHCCLVFLCSNNLEQSYECFERHWALLKYASNGDRNGLGLWDNQIILQMAYWFFVKYSEDFRDFYSIKCKTRVGKVWNHKKISLLYFLEYDHSWVVSFCGLPFYNYARKFFPKIPEHELKRSTPTNVTKIWSENCNFENYPVGKEKYYLRQYHQETNLSSKFPDPDISNDYLYSYYHYQTDYAEETNHNVSLVEFIRKHINDDDYKSVIHVGCGINPPIGFANKKYLGIDISEKVCSILEEKGKVQYVHKPATLFLQDTKQHFDLCFACDFLNHLSPHRLNMFLSACSKKCSYLAAKIDTTDDIRRDILGDNKLASPINLHLTVRSPDEWISIIKSHFNNIHHAIEGAWVYVIGF